MGLAWTLDLGLLGLTWLAIESDLVVRPTALGFHITVKPKCIEFDMPPYSSFLGLTLPSNPKDLGLD